MKILSYRTTMPFDNRSNPAYPSISPPTEKSVMPFNNVLTIQDVLDNRKSISDFYPHAGGDWSPGHDTQKNYREKGDDYKRKERDLEILNNLIHEDTPKPEKWKVKVPGGSVTFYSFEMAQKYKEKLKDRGINFTYISRVAQAENLSTAEVVADSIGKCFLVESLDVSAGVKEAGSAFCIAPSYFVTCAHVVKQYDKNSDLNNIDFSDSFIKLVQNGNWFRAEVIDIDFRWDIALLKCDIDAEPLQLDKTIAMGDDIIAIGSPHGYENNVSTGNVGSLGRQIYFYDDAPEYMFVDLSVYPGNSGGPVIKESNGKVIGMITLIVSGGGEYGLNAALPSNYIEEFCRRTIKDLK
jgi:S1-C subfamily serine protease